jgi:hypothetical protein
MGSSEHEHGGKGRTSLGLGFSAVQSAKKTMSELKQASGCVRSSRSHTIVYPFPMLWPNDYRIIGLLYLKIEEDEDRRMQGEAKVKYVKREMKRRVEEKRCAVLED